MIPHLGFGFETGRLESGFAPGCKAGPQALHDRRMRLRYHPPMSQDALILANDLLRDTHGKSAHALVRGPSRYVIRGVIDASCAGRDAGEVLDGRSRDIPVLSVPAALAALPKAAASAGLLEGALKKFASDFPGSPKAADLAKTAAQAPAWASVEAWEKLLRSWSYRFTLQGASEIAPRLQAIKAYRQAHSRAPFVEALGAYEEAGKLYREALPIFEKAFGSEHPKYAICLNGLASLLHERRWRSSAPIWRTYRRVLCSRWPWWRKWPEGRCRRISSPSWSVRSTIRSTMPKA